MARGYRMWAKTDRCAADYDLRGLLRRIAEARASIAQNAQTITLATDPKVRAKAQASMEISQWALPRLERNAEELKAQIARMEAQGQIPQRMAVAA